MALGVSTCGLATLACGLVVVGGAGYAGGTIGGGAGEWGGDLIGDLIYGN